MNTEATDALIRLALAEDIGTGDRTTLATIPADARAQAVVVAKAPLVVAGGVWFARSFALCGGDVAVQTLVADGQAAEPGTVVLRLSGGARELLMGERTALNILQRLSGIATLTRRYVDAVAGTGARICDTRKTGPGMRTMEKHAVRMGGGSNHRFGLDSGILIKENHIAACGGLTRAVERVRSESPHGLRIEVEVTTLDELDEALAAGVDIVLLDNMDDATTREAVARIRRAPGRVLAEASGNLGLDRVRRVAELGVDLLSVGALTHSAPAADLSMRVIA
ncbi:MAG: carboxylating nicotinate-nucleotide diphosphorylase [Deltaproteobacteria bacterium]|nr:carboxylating nicotinate-nucleotide diphosphorylase [Deltaproteobacteria bacterium]MCB9787764.1 carboxylating nicotinate-nucleotide diphosphorylase [Deltaproteobacteria bacterium]